jgi:DNA-3-methyladenine glycosylase II
VALNDTLSDTDAKQVHAYINDWFDLRRDLAPFYRLLKKNKQLAFMAGKYAGLRMIGIPDMHEALCWCIIGQQINLGFAHTLKRRLTEQYGESLEYNGHTYYAFPAPIILAGLTVDELKLLQFSTRKAEYVIGVSQLVAAGDLSKEQLEQLPTFEAQVAALVSIRGIGLWTANYVLMKSLGRMQSITYGDAGLNKALQTIAGFEKNPGKELIDAYFKPFKGWEAYLVFYFWRTLS